MTSVTRISSCIALLGLLHSPSMVRADVEDRIFDFTDAFYLENGINPAVIIGRPQADGVNAFIDNNTPGPEFRNVRLLGHTACYDHSGHITFFSVVGLVFPNTFTNDAVGQEAREIAETYKIYEFPRASATVNSVFPKNQDAVVDLTNGYFSNDPLGTWQVNIMHYTAAAFNTSGGQKTLTGLAAENGYTLDGTPIVRTLSEIEDLADAGLISITIPPDDGSALRWFMCPIPKDLTDGTIAPDAFETVVSLDDGRVLPDEAEFLRKFKCLHATGEFCDDLLGLINQWGGGE